jgi:hypothetical protein
VRRLLLTLSAVALAAGCGSTLQRPDGGGAGNTGAGGTGGTSDSGQCVVNGMTYPNGAEFPCSPGGCAPCGCMNGQVTIFTVDCNVDGPVCRIDTTYTYGDTGGLVAYEDTTTLIPPTTWHRARTSHITDPASSVCEVPLLCDLVGAVTGDLGGVVEIEHIKIDLADGKVQRAFSLPAPPVYGRDTRPFDGTVFQLLRDDGHGFVMGADCGGETGCTDIPGGISKLVADLHQLDARQLMDPACASLR